MFSHLHTYSYYSFLEGLASPAELVTAAGNQNMPAIALTDRRGLTGAVEFVVACREAGIKPVLGTELPLLCTRGGSPASAPVAPLVLLALDLQGWGNICRLSSALLSDPETLERGFLLPEQLSAHSEGLICLAGGVNSPLAAWVASNQEGLARAWLQSLAEFFPDRLYIELQRLRPPDKAITIQLDALASRLGFPSVATHPVQYLLPGQAELQRVVTAMRLNTPLSRLPESAAALPGSFFISAQEMQERFADLPEALTATEEIVGRCTLELPLGQQHYPQVDLPEGRTPAQVLRQRAFEGAAWHYGSLTPEIKERLESELAVITGSGYTSIFLIMSEIMQFAYQAGVPTASRGSASSSLVAHCLGITTPDPLELNLYFERFLNPARSTPPDIDTDLCSRGRDLVIEHVYQKYGADRVAMVCTINRFRRRSALREVAKAHGFSSTEINQLVSSLPYRGWSPRQAFTSPSDPYAELAQRYPSARHQAVFRHAAGLLKTPHHLSIHPGGIVISPGPILDLIPTQLASKGLVITQFDLESVEQLGLIKLDLLGIRGLSVLGDVADVIHKRTSASQRSRLDALDSIPEDDALTSELVRNGQTIGCFQIESPGMRATLREIQADSVADILVALALYRPGPLKGGLKDAFVNRHLGVEPVVHLHPSLEPLLADTHGVILYQEQVLRIAHEIAGFSLAEADLLRRAMSHFDPGEQMQTLMEKFRQGAWQHKSIPPETAGHIWSLMAAFAGYGFPKAHAASYAVVAWRAAWCKAHYPAEFMAAVLANWGGYYSQRVYLMETRRLGLPVRPPHINYSQPQFSVDYSQDTPVLYMGLDQVRDLTRRTLGRILDSRPFSSLSDFLVRVDPRFQEAENLIQAGALQGLGTIPELLRQTRPGSWKAGQLPLFHLDAQPSNDSASPDWSLAQRAAAQESILGISVDVHPLELVADALAAAAIVSTSEAAARLGERLRIAGIRQTTRRAGSLSEGNYFFLTLEDLEGFMEVAIPAILYRRNRSILSYKGPIGVEGVPELDPESGEVQLQAARLWRI